MPKQSETPQEKPTDNEEEEWKLLLNTLHKHLPKFFASVEEGQDPTSVKLKSDMEYVLGWDKDGEWQVAPTQRAVVTVAHQYKILHKFLKNFNGKKPDEPFEFAGFHFVFRIDRFVKKYKHHIPNRQIREILRALGINENTINSYLKKDFTDTGDMPKQSQIPLEKPTDHEEDEWKILLDILHTHLPKFFPSGEEAQDPTSVKLRSDMEYVLGRDQDSEWKFAPTQHGVVKVAHQYKILHKFLENFNRDEPDEPLEFAGFNFEFRINLFVEKYSTHVTRHQMREILRALRINKATIKSYIRDFSDNFLLDDVNQFIKDFKAYVGKKENTQRPRFPFDEITVNLSVTEEELRDFVDVYEVDEAGIIISVATRKIRYRPRLLGIKRIG